MAEEHRWKNSRSAAWQKVEKMPGWHDIPAGTTRECLSMNQVAAHMNSGEEEPRIIEHLKDCGICREGIARFKASNTF